MSDLLGLVVIFCFGSRCSSKPTDITDSKQLHKENNVQQLQQNVEQLQKENMAAEKTKKENMAAERRKRENMAAERRKEAKKNAETGSIDTGGGRGTKASLGGKGKAEAKFSVQKGAPTVSNFCKQADILRVVDFRQDAITCCYENELARNPELGGKVTLSWIIKFDGSVHKVWVESSSLKNGIVENCMTRSVKRWRFTKPDGHMCLIKFPFVFNSGL